MIFQELKDKKEELVKLIIREVDTFPYLFIYDEPDQFTYLYFDLDLEFNVYHHGYIVEIINHKIRINSSRKKDGRKEYIENVIDEMLERLENCECVKDINNNILMRFSKKLVVNFERTKPIADLKEIGEYYADFENMKELVCEYGDIFNINKESRTGWDFK